MGHSGSNQHEKWSPSNIDRKALSVRNNHIHSFFTTTRKCLLWINKQLINLDYDDMKNVLDLSLKTHSGHLCSIIVKVNQLLVYPQKTFTCSCEK